MRAFRSQQDARTTMLTYHDAISLGIVHALGQGEPDSELQHRTLVNLAGTQLIAMHAWNWCSRPAIAVDLVQGQPWAELPPELAEINDVCGADALVLTAHLTSKAHLLDRRRAKADSPSIVLWCALSFDNPDNDDIAAEDGMRPILELHPVPQFNGPQSILLDWRAGWRRVTAQTDQAQALPLPADGSCDLLYIKLLRAITKGFETEHEGSMEDLLDRLRASSVFKDAVRLDTRRQSYRGQLRNGLLNAASPPTSPYKQTLSTPVTGYQAL